MEGVDLSEFSAEEDVVQQVNEKANFREGKVIIVHGWTPESCAFSDDLSDELPPVAVFNLSLHGVRTNQKARKILKDKFGDVVDKFDNQRWLDRHVWEMLNRFARMDASPERLAKFYSHLLKDRGVYHAEEMLLAGEEEVRIFKEAELTERTQFWAVLDNYKKLPEGVKEMVRGVKLFADGALGVQTAALNQPYQDGTTGSLMYQDRALLEAELEKCLSLVEEIAVHAIGDKAIDHVVDACEVVRRKLGQESKIRIEHAQLISRDSALRAKDLGVKLCMQPNFSDDSVIYTDRLPDEYLDKNNPFRMLIDEVGYVPGEDLFFGSDGMPHGVHEALRQSLFPAYPEQCLTLDEFVAGYCLKKEKSGYIEISIDVNKLSCTIVTPDDPSFQPNERPEIQRAGRLAVPQRRFQSSKKKVNGGNMFFRHNDSAPDRETLLFVHGLGESSLSFQEAFESPSLSRFRIIAPDLLGFGQSSDAEYGNYSFDAQISGLIKLLDLLEVSSFTVIGHSMGGDLGTIICDEHPERVKRFLNIEGNLTSHDLFITELAIAQRACFERWLRQDFPSSVVGEWLHSTNATSRASLGRYIASLTQCRTSAFLQSAEEILRVNEPGKRQVCTRIGAKYLGLKPPKIYCCSETLSKKSVSFLHIADEQNRRFEDAGHWVMIDQAKVFYDFLAGFIDSTP